MPEIDFLADNQKKEEEKPVPHGEEKVNWTEPPKAADTGKAGWLSVFKKTAPSPSVDGLKPGSRQEALNMIKNYVGARESSPPKENAAEPVVSPSPPGPGVSQEAFSPQKEESPDALSETGSAEPSTPELSQDGAGSDNKKSGWLKFLFGAKKPKTGKAREITVLATDLIKGEIITFFDWKKNLLLLLFFVILSLMVLAGIYQALDIWENSKQQQILNFTEKFKNLSIDIRQAEKDARNILLMQKKLVSVKTLLAEHIYWTNFFKFLEENTLGDVFYSGFSGNNKGNYALAATAKDFNTIAEQIKTFQANELVSRAATAGGQAGRNDQGSGSVSFDLQLSIDPVLFNRK